MSVLERTNLEAHVDLCSERYKQLDQRMTAVEQQIKEINIDLIDMKDTINKNHGEIKQLLLVYKGEKFKAIIASSSAIIVALIGTIGYMVQHIK